MPATDVELVRGALDGAESAFREIVLRYQRPIYGLIVRMVKDPARAEELAQEALLRAYKAWPRIRRQDPGPYVRTALMNLCRNDYRRRLLERAHPSEAMPDVEFPDTKIEEAMRLPHRRARGERSAAELAAARDAGWRLHRGKR